MSHLRSIGLLLGFFFFMLHGLHAQIYSGTWRGHQHQPGGPVEEYSYEVTLVQKGDKVTGITICSVPSLGISVHMKLIGTVKGGTLYFEETEILTNPYIKTNDIDGEWCVLKGYLKLGTDGNKAYLMGVAAGKTQTTSCLPCAIYLERKVDRA